MQMNTNICRYTHNCDKMSQQWIGQLNYNNCMQDNLSSFNPLDSDEKPISYKLVAAISISLIVHGVFFVFKNTAAQSKPVTLPLHIVITATKSAMPELLPAVEETLKPAPPIKPEPPAKHPPAEKKTRTVVKPSKKKKRPVTKKSCSNTGNASGQNYTSTRRCYNSGR